ncbi:TSUP family transporter [Vulgatibacter incomptus]|uniref:Probable membrane transporter protein n=1 Tax=Vulgatibacter incomptus TaxID=1391653 RepID=A0A0K1PHW2_9BACT|nr:TSUP family transporter [Vulgatibacter incomptus]AKU93128.1 Membrane protein, putative [Vulgatibacter incomptus]
MDIALPELALLTSVAFIAGVVDAIAGGGGLLTLPALLAVGLPPHLALGTNKGQSVFGSGAALAGYARARMIDGRLARIGFPLGLVGSLAGAALVMLLDPSLLRPVVLVLLVAVALFLAFKPAVASGIAPSPKKAAWLTAALALGLGAYDGFFGPGVGTFLIVGFVWLLGMPVARASANAKVVNFASNLAALLLFAQRGAVLPAVAAPMAAAQLAGGFLGARLAARGGDVLVRRAVLMVVTALVIKLGFDLLH